MSEERKTLEQESDEYMKVFVGDYNTKSETIAKQRAKIQSLEAERDRLRDGHIDIANLVQTEAQVNWEHIALWAVNRSRAALSNKTEDG